MATTMTTGWERRSTNGGLMALAGGALTVVGVFLPWVTGGGESFTGWELYDLRQAAGDNPFIIDDMFGPGSKVLFTGAPVLVFGALLAIIGIAVYATKKRPPPARYRVSPGLYFTGAFVAVWAAVMLALNAFSILTPPAFVEVSMGIGLAVSFAGAVLAMVGIGQSAAKRSELAAAPAAWPPQAPVTAQPQPVAGAPQPPNWYPDPAGHHQMRFWDGTTWSSHVSDGGVQSEDPLVPTP